MLPIFISAAKKKGYKVAEEDKGLLLGLNKGSLFSIFFFHVREREGSVECLS